SARRYSAADSVHSSASRIGLSVVNATVVTSVAIAVRRMPARSSRLRGVTATVTSHSPATIGSSTSVSASVRITLGPHSKASAGPDTTGHGSAASASEDRQSGEPATASSSAAQTTAKLRSCSSSSLVLDAITTASGSAATAASQIDSAVIIRLRSAQPPIYPIERRGQRPKRRDHQPIEQRVEEPALEREQVQPPVERGRSAAAVDLLT